jgi:hypothetical protein
MKTKTLKCAEPDYQALQDELERRYGPALAQDIVDQIRKTEAPDFIPGYVAVKAASEVLELFRGETREALRKLKGSRTTKAANDDGRLVSLETARLRHEFERLFDLYFLSQRGFYRIYRKAMSAYIEESPARKYRLPGHEKSHEQELAQGLAMAG